MAKKVKDTGSVLREIESLLESCDELLECGAPGRTCEFAQSVKESAESMYSWIETNGVATEKQARAIENWTIAIQNALDSALDDEDADEDGV